MSDYEWQNPIARPRVPSLGFTPVAVTRKTWAHPGPSSARTAPLPLGAVLVPESIVALVA